MQPSIEMRIRTMIKAMNEVVTPAVDPDNRAAIEQAALVTASLGMIVDQIDHAHWYETADVALMTRMIGELADISPGDTADKAIGVAKIADEAAGRNSATLSEIRENGRLLRDAICALIEDIGMLGDSTKLDQANAAVLALSQLQIDRERAYVARSGFDSSPETLKSMPQALAAT